jgi:lipopolysaccharide export system permease protein
MSLEQSARGGPSLSRLRRLRLAPWGHLTRYVLREVGAPMILALLVIGFLAVAQKLRQEAQAQSDLLAYVSLTDLALLVFYLLPTLITLIIPTTYMMGILLAFGRLAQNNEITAMRAAGVPLKRIILPVLVCGALLSALSFILQDRVQPAAMARINDLLYTRLPQRVVLDSLEPGIMHDEFGDWSVYFRDRDPKTRTLYGLMVKKPDGDGRLIFYAESACLTETELVMTNPTIISQQEKGANRFKGISVPLAIPRIAGKKVPGQRRALTLAELLRQEAAQRSEPTISRGDLRKLRWEISDRFCFPLACFAVSLVAAPLAVRSPSSGRSHSFAIGFVILLVYYVLRDVLEPNSLKSMAEVALRSAAPNLVLATAGIWALWRVDRV